MTSTEQTSKSPKFDVSEMIFILHYRKDSEDRERNLREVLNFLKENFNAKVVLFHDKKDDDKRPNISSPTYVYRFIKNNGEFRKAYCFNSAAERRSEKIFCFWDVDVIIEPENIKKAYDCLMEGKVDHVYPFNGTFIDVNEAMIPNLVNKDFDNLYNLYQKGHDWLELASTESPGGCNMITREAFEKIGGYDERFIGWGFEDTDFFHRSLKVNRLGRITDEKAICWHMHHDQAIRLENPHYQNNLRIFNENCAK